MNPVFKSPESERVVFDLYRDILARSPIVSREHRIETRVGETFVLECGREDAPPLILLHGTAANAASWMVDLPLWSQYFRVFAIDIIGDAGLSAQVRPPLETEAHALWFDDVLAGLSLTSAAFLGMSFGGWVALDYATRRPERVSKLVLLSPGGVGKSKNILLWAIPLLLLGPYGRRKMLERIGGRIDAPLSPEAADIVTLSKAIFAHFKPRRSDLPQFTEEALQKLTMPVLAILGGRDVFIDAQETKRRLENNVPNLIMRYLPDGYHFMPGQTETVLQFLNS